MIGLNAGEPATPCGKARSLPVVPPRVTLDALLDAVNQPERRKMHGVSTVPGTEPRGGAILSRMRRIVRYRLFELWCAGPGGKQVLR
jgi:hypothetical protein